MELIRPAILSLSVIVALFSLPANAEKPAGEAKGKAQAVSQKLVWQNNYSQTLRLAGSQRKWVLVDVYTDWCHWCKVLDKEVYANPKIAQFLNKSFVCMKADAEKGDGLMVAQKYGVNGYPCTLILKPNGEEKGRINGYVELSRFPVEVSKVVAR